MRSLTGLVIALAMLGGCGVGEFDGPDEFDPLAAKAPDLFKRVVIARLYQKNDWTLPAAGTTSQERIAYACARFKPLHPTYVSGLIRLDDDAPMTADQIEVFSGVRDCLREQDPKVKLDVVLNAEHYADDERHTRQSAIDALKQRGDEIKALGADIVFFDFFSSPYNGSKQHEKWHPESITEGTQYIRNQLDLKVGGNVWGLEPPPNADFIALDNFDRVNDAGETTDGFEYNKQQIAAFKGTPILLHIENNPQKSPSKGLQWINGEAAYRREVLAKFTARQKSDGFSYMYPVFFPLQCCVAGNCGPDQCKVSPSDRIAYDASTDDDTLSRIDDGLGK